MYSSSSQGKFRQTMWFAFLPGIFLVIPQSYAEDNFKGIEEIVVTAEKRESTVQDTAIAVTAFSDEALDVRQIATTSDMQYSVPNMLFSKTNFEGSSISIRGVVLIWMVKQSLVL